MSETKVCDKTAMRDLAEGVLALLGDDCFLVLNERNNENSRLKMKQSIAHAMTKGNVCHDGMKGIFVQPHCDDAKECLFLRFVGEPYVIDIDSSRRAIVCKVRASGLTGLQLEYHEPSTPAAAPQQAALNSLRVRFAPTMLYPPARAAFEAALNSKAKKPGFVGTESRSVYAEATPLPSSRGYAEAGRNSGESEPPLNAGELAALKALGGELNAEQVAADAEYAAREMMAGLRGKQRRGRDVARNSEATNEAEFILEFESLEIQAANDKAENCNQHGHDADCPGPTSAGAPEKESALAKVRDTEDGQTMGSIFDSLATRKHGEAPSVDYIRQAPMSKRTADEIEAQIQAMPQGVAEKQLKGQKLSATQHAVSPMLVQHALKEHPYLKKEDLQLCPDIRENWDSMKVEPRTNWEGVRVEYKKKYGGETYILVEQLRPSRKGDISFFKSEYIQGKLNQ